MSINRLNDQNQAINQDQYSKKNIASTRAQTAENEIGKLSLRQKLDLTNKIGSISNLIEQNEPGNIHFETTKIYELLNERDKIAITNDEKIKNSLCDLLSNLENLRNQQPDGGSRDSGWKYENRPNYTNKTEDTGSTVLTEHIVWVKDLIEFYYEDELEKRFAEKVMKAIETDSGINEIKNPKIPESNIKLKDWKNNNKHSWLTFFDKEAGEKSLIDLKECILE